MFLVEPWQLVFSRKDFTVWLMMLWIYLRWCPEINDAIKLDILAKLAVQPAMPVLVHWPFSVVHALVLIEVGCKYIPNTKKGIVRSNEFNPPAQWSCRSQSSAIPVAVNGALKELHGIFNLSQLPVGRFHLSPYAADAGVALERVCPPLWFLVHHPQHVAAALLGCAQLLWHDESAEIRTVQ